MELRRREPDLRFSVVHTSRSVKRKRERSFFPPTAFCREARDTKECKCTHLPQLLHVPPLQWSWGSLQECQDLCDSHLQSLCPTLTLGYCPSYLSSRTWGLLYCPHPSVCPSVRPSIYPLMLQSVHTSMHTSMHVAIINHPLSVHSSIVYTCVHSCTCPSIRACFHPCIHPSGHPSIIHLGVLLPHEHLHTFIHACIHHLSSITHPSFIHPRFCLSIRPSVIPVGRDPPSQPPTALLGARRHNAAKVNVTWGQGTEGHLLPLPPPSPVEGTCGVGPGAVGTRRFMSGFVPTPGPHQL